ncbi:MAG: AAA family ATPase [Zestosphaera sp.]
MSGLRDIATRVQKFEEELKRPFVGRDEESRVVVLALLTGEHALLVGEPGCVTGDTIISSEDGKLLYLDDVAKNLVPGVYIADFPVFPPGRATELHVYDVWETYEVITGRGFRLRGTPNHPVLTDRGWVSMRDLRRGDKVRVLTQLPSPTHYVSIPSAELLGVRLKRSGVRSVGVLDERLAEVLGAFVMRGSYLSNYSVGFRVGIDEGELRGRIETLMKDLFNLEPRVIQPRSSQIVKYSSGYLVKLFKWLAGRGRERVPWSILASPDRVSAAFLRSVLECGSVLEWGSRACLTLRGRSRTFLEGVQILLLRYGVLSSIRDRSAYGGYVLSVEGSCNLRRLVEMVGLDTLRHKFGGSLRMECRAGGMHVAGFEWDEVKSVRRLEGWVRVYDFHVPDTHSFFTNGLLSHNTAKSALVRRAAELLNAKFFKYLLTKYTEPSELFGPLDIKALEDGRYVRLTAGKLPDAQIAFLDEIFKANSAILNALNTLLQERMLYDGFTELRVDLWTLFGASNEVPEDPEIQSVYDRFLLRHFVRPVQEDLWRGLLRASWELERANTLGSKAGDGGRILSVDELKRINASLYEVDLSGVEGKLLRLFAALESRGIHLTDRRKGKSLKVIAANALIGGRRYAVEEDLLTVKYVATREWDDLEKVNAVLAEELKTSYKYLRELSEIKTNLKELLQYVKSLEGIESSFVAAKFETIERELEVTKARILSIMRESQDPQVLRLGEDVLSLVSSITELVGRRADRV